MKVIELNPDDRRQVKQFLQLPFYLYKDTPQWVPPLSIDAKRPLDRKRFPFYRHSEAAFYLAYNNQGEPAGRLAVLNNRRYNDFNHEKTAFFCFFECENDQEVAGCLFERAFAWAKNQGLDRMVGPKGFTPFDGLGMLVKGFEHRPAFGIPYNLAYYPDLIESQGFTSQGEIVSGYLESSMQFPEKIQRASELIQKRRGLRIARYRTRSELRSLVPHLQRLYNDSMEGTSGNVPLTDEEVKQLADQLIWFANPRLIKIIFKDDEPVGFLFAYPDISAALQRTSGRLFPFGWIDMLLELKRTKWVNINGAGIVEKYRGLGGTAILFSEMYQSVVEGKFLYGDLVQIGAENDNMQRELEGLGINFYKTHRMYNKPLM